MIEFKFSILLEPGKHKPTIDPYRNQSMQDGFKLAGGRNSLQNLGVF